MGASTSSPLSSTTALLEFDGHDGLLYANGKPFSIKGVNWFGSEAYNGPPGGLNVHDVDWYMDFLQSHGFNAIRLLFTHEYVLKNDIVEAPKDSGPGHLLFQIRYVPMFAALAKAAAARGILIMLACHRVKHDAWPGLGLWHDASLGYPVERVLESWGMMASQLCGQWNIFASTD